MSDKRIKVKDLHDSLYDSYLDYSRRIRRTNIPENRQIYNKVQQKIYDKATVWCKNLDQDTISKSKVKDKLDSIQESILN